jgi:hypothetical protein
MFYVHYGWGGGRDGQVQVVGVVRSEEGEKSIVKINVSMLNHDFHSEREREVYYK